MSSHQISRGYIKLSWPLFGILIIGLLGILSNEFINIMRDISYALLPIILIYLGNWIAISRIAWSQFLKIIILIGFIFALIHLSTFVYDPALLFEDMLKVRATAGQCNDLVTFSLILGLVQYRLGLGNLFFRLLPRWIVLPILLGSFILSYSRTEFLIGIILLLSLFGILSNINIRFILTGIVFVFCFYLLQEFTVDDGVNFITQLKKSFSEISISGYSSLEDIMANWRGFESYLLISNYLSGDINDLIFGRGFGALADVGFNITLAGEDYRYLPVFHNGYFYILFKTGLVGLILYSYFYLRNIRYSVIYSRSQNQEKILLGRLTLGLTISIAFSMLIVGGMAQMHSIEFVLLLGFLLKKLELKPNSKLS